MRSFLRLDPLKDHPRYRHKWRDPFVEAAAEALRPDVVVVDLGGGRRPAISRADLPARARYIGLDLSRAELTAAPPGSYDQMIEADIAEYVPELAGAADLIVSWQVLEHVAPMEAAVRNLHGYLRPGGRLVAQLSGANGLFAVLNRAIPHRVAAASLHHLLGRRPETVFPARYDRCTHTGMARLFADWSDVRILPRYHGAGYFRFLPPLQWAYVKAEDFIANGRHRDLATHYLIVADR